MDEAPPKVFLSYSHDSEEHRASVRALADRLRRDGVDAQLDQYVASPDQGWPLWMQQQLRDADFTLVVCTKSYRERFDQSDRSDGSMGVKWEGAIVTLALYEGLLHNANVIPVLLSKESIESVPTVLRGVTRYKVDEPDQYEMLYARIRGMAPVTAPPVGVLRPPRLTLSSASYEALVLPEWDLSSKGLAGRRDVRTNLPDAGTQFIGRSDELERTRANVLRHKAVTLTAPAGTGKTRLALAAARSLLEEFRDGVWWVDLASLSDAREIPHSMAQMLGIFQQPEQAAISSVVHALRRSQMLIVFDNCERHTLDVAQLIDRITRACPDVHVLATSRETVGAEDEYPQGVRPLSAPAPHEASIESVRNSDGGALFVSRARLANPAFQLATNTDARAIAQICESTLGVPLAIELAAGATSVADIGTVASGIREAVELIGASQRERALEAAIEWCYWRLDDAERELWERMSVFDGSFDEAAMSAVCGEETMPSATLDLAFDRLQARAFVTSALRFDSGDGASLPSRFRLLESLRHFARQRLVEKSAMQELRHRHAQYYLRLAELARPQLRQQDQRLWLRALEADHDDLKAALAWWKNSGDPERAMRLGGALGRFWHMRGYWHEGRRLLREVLDMPGVNQHPSARAKALVAKGHLAFVGGDYRSAKNFYEEALAVREQIGEAGDIADSLHRVGCVAEVLNDLPRAHLLQDSSLKLARQVGNDELEADVLHHLGVLAGMTGDHEAAEAYLQQSLELRRARGDRWGEAWSLVVLGNHHRYLDDVDEAAKCYHESLRLYEAQGDRRRIASALFNVADINVRERDFETARKNLNRATHMVHDLGDMRGVAEALETWSVLAAAKEQPERCFTLLGAADALREDIGAVRSPLAQAWLDRSTVGLKVSQPERLDWHTAGQRLSPDSAIRYADDRTIPTDGR